MIDLHCHIDLYPDPKEIIAKCAQKKAFVLSVTTTPSAFKITNSLSEGHDRIRTALGLHPQIAHERYGELNIFEEFIPDVRYLGEIGLDGSKFSKQHFDIQLKVFREILQMSAKHGGRIMSIHSRSAATDVIKALKQFPNAGVPIFHWFSGTSNELIEAIELGAWFSINPAMTKSQKGRSIIELIPPDKILTETDGPFLTENDIPLYPWDSVLSYPTLANIWKITIDEVHQKLLDNLRKLTSQI